MAALPLWMYCDDTSGNISKKWNEHNSFLFTLAGLPGHETSKEFNIHFLCTSNLAPPLEMLDGVVNQLEYVALFLIKVAIVSAFNYYSLEQLKKMEYGLGIVFGKNQF